MKQIPQAAPDTESHTSRVSFPHPRFLFMTTVSASTTAPSSASSSGGAMTESVSGESDSDVEFLGISVRGQGRGGQGGQWGQGQGGLEEQCYVFLASSTLDALVPRARASFDAFALALCERLGRPLTDGELVACAWCACAAQCVFSAFLLSLLCLDPFSPRALRFSLFVPRCLRRGYCY